MRVGSANGGSPSRGRASNSESRGTVVFTCVWLSTARIVAINAARAESTGLWARATAGAPPPSTSAASSACLMKAEEERKLGALTAHLADGVSCAARVHPRKTGDLRLKRVG